MRRAAVLFVIASVINYPWEVGQMPLYLGDKSWLQSAVHCLIPSLGDGAIVLLIFLCGLLVFRRAGWADRPGLAGYALMLASGAALSVFIEWGAVHVLQRWSYAAGMPQLPGFNVGVVPVLQMLLLPPLVFRLTARWLGGRR
ncbi:MAG: hypothetical protein H7332_19465 [Bdellovibrionales bacterium]|nr:hypothetical protein [Ramlibacter sp.]